MEQTVARARALLVTAAEARGKGQAADEKKAIDAALKLAPGDPQVRNAAGMAALNRQDYRAAARHFAAAAKADPAQPPLWMNLATAHRQLGDDDGEDAALRQALDIDRLNFMAQLRLAQLNERRGRTQDAVLGWRGVLQMAAGMPDIAPPLRAVLDAAGEYLAAHGTRVSAAIDATLGTAIETAGAGARRFNACVDAALGRRSIYTNDCAGLHFPFLPADEFFDDALFPWFAELEAKTEEIREEALRLARSGGAHVRPYIRQDSGTPENKWTALDHSLDWSAIFLWEYGERNEAVCAECPVTATALAAIPQNHIPGKAPTAFFSVLQPHAHIPPHTGVTNTRAIVHLPLVVPDGCRFRVGGETRDWMAGKAFAFDDTIEHEAWNDSDEPRIVLILDVWNPHLTRTEQQLIKGFYEAAGTV